MKTCSRCGYQNADDSKKCANCLVDLHWAKVNLGKFTGTPEDTKRIGEEERKLHSTVITEDGNKPDFLSLYASAIFIGACSTFIAQFVKTANNNLYGLGLIDSCWLIAIFLSPIAGAVIAFILCSLIINKGYSPLKVNLSVAVFNFLAGLFLFSMGGCF